MLQPLEKTRRWGEGFMVPAKLLLVDDEEDFVTALAERLRIRNFQTKVVTSGEDALMEIRKERPDIVLLDLKMPVMDGLETMKRIKLKDSSIYVIIVTGSMDQHVGDQAIKAGADNYLVKPFDIESLLDTMKDLYNERRQAQM